MKNGYDVAFRFPDNELFVLPVTPAQIKMSVGSNNEVVTLINGGDINIPKSPQLIEISFEARFPMRQYPYAKVVQPYQNYFEKFKKVKEDKKPFTFLVARETPSGMVTWDTELTVLLESFDVDEDAENGDDVLITFELKQYKTYGTKSVDKPTPSRTEKIVDEREYTIQAGDTLWGIAKKFYGDGTYWTSIYNYNKSIFEAEAKRRGLASSDNGHWIFAGCTILIPNATVANQNKTTTVNESTGTNKYSNLKTLASSSHEDESPTLNTSEKNAELRRGSKYDKEDDDARYGGYDQVNKNIATSPNRGVLLNETSTESNFEVKSVTTIIAVQGDTDGCGWAVVSGRGKSGDWTWNLLTQGGCQVTTTTDERDDNAIKVTVQVKPKYAAEFTHNAPLNKWETSRENFNDTIRYTCTLQKPVCSSQVVIRVYKYSSW